MRIYISIRNKIVLLVLTVSLVIYIISIGYLVTNTSETLKGEAYTKVSLSAEKAAFEVRSRLEEYMGIATTLSQSFEIYPTLDSSLWEPIFLDMLQNSYRNHKEITTFWDSYEYSQFRTNYTSDVGRLSRYMYYDDNKNLKVVSTELSMNGDPEPYANFKLINAPDIWEPYLDTTSENSQSGIMMTTVASPIRRNSRFAGMVGLDITLNWMQDFVREIKPFDESTSFLLSGRAHIASHPDASLLGKSVDALFGIVAKNENIEEKVRKGESASFIYQDLEKNVDYYVYLAPISVSNANSNWSLGIYVPLNVITRSADASLKVTIFVGLIAIVLLIIALLKIAALISRPIVQMTAMLNTLARGDIDSDVMITLRSGDEMEWMSVAMNRLLNGLRHLTKLATSISSGDLSQEVHLLGENDSLGKSLIAVRNSLRMAKIEEEKREIENKNRAWVNHGLAEFSKLLRENSNHLDSLCENFLFAICHFIGAEMGALYLRDEERHQRRQDDIYNLKVTFAWGEKRYLAARYVIGEGLIGSCAMEKKHIFLTEIPDDFSAIMAGVGQAPPRCLLVVPLLHEGEAIAVLEVASFEEFPPHVVEFLNNLSVYVAASIFTVEVGMNTKQLLAQAQEQSEELKAQDEELRQNLEELKATQEEADRKREENESLFTALSAALFYVEYDLDGYATDVSPNYLERLQITREEVINKHFSEGSSMDGANRAKFNDFWREVRSGKSKRTSMTQNVNGNELQLLEFYLPLKDQTGKVYKIMKLSFEV
ncbi:MAG: GAF domain-containing protein [Bacteroides sp.]